LHEIDNLNSKLSTPAHLEGFLLNMSIIHQQFTQPLLAWFNMHGRKTLPWQNPRSAYRVWISEIMLQQTQVQTVIPYFLRFLERFPSVASLAQASVDDVLVHWAGLGYYSRARNLHKTAIIIQHDFKGEFPSTLQALQSLPGIGPSTAAAIASLAFDQPTAILDGNVRRVLSRYFLINGLPTQTTFIQTLWELANTCMSKNNCADYTQAIMDLGATCCTTHKPRCDQCPLQMTCLAKRQNVVENYPQKKMKVKLPVKSQQFILLHNTRQQIYLEKRPPIGIWGGLWCLPVLEMEESPEESIYSKYNVQTLEIQKIMQIKHTFSHFHLNISALAMKSKPALSTCITESSGRWFMANEIDALGLAKPVRMIIDTFLAKAYLNN
jgi:A/G-specific adenine glycosylase